MKKTTLTLLALICALCCVFGLAACASKDETPTHTHSYQWVDNGDGTHKQHCSVSGCDAPDINSGKHEYGTNDKCVCGATKSAVGHAHDYSTLWTTDETYHWHECNGVGGTCDTKEKDKAEHTDGNSDGKCDACQYDMGGVNRTLTQEQIYTAYKNVGIAIYDNDRQQMYSIRNVNRIAAYTEKSASVRLKDGYQYSLSILNHLNDCLTLVEPIERGYSLRESLYSDEEFLLYFRAAEYCTAQKDFECGKWHKSDTSEVYCCEMYVNVWYDNDYIYFCYAVKIRDAIGNPDEGDVYIFSYSTLDYDYDSKNFHCSIFIGESSDLSAKALFEAQIHRVYEFCCENGDFYGYDDGYLYNYDGKIYNFCGYQNGKYDEEYEGERYGENIENGLTKFFEEIRPDADAYSAIAEKLDEAEAVDDGFALNYFLNNTLPDSFIDYRERVTELYEKLTSLPDGAFKKFIDDNSERWKPDCEKAMSASISDWVYINPQLVYESMGEDEILREPKIIFKSFYGKDNEFKESELSIMNLFIGFGNWDHIYTDEECTHLLTLQDFADFEFGKTVLYEKY